MRKEEVERIVKSRGSFSKFYKENYNAEYGAGEIKLFDKQIRRALVLASQKSLKSAKAREEMKALGFEVVKSSGYAFIGKRQVIKVALVLSDPFSRKTRSEFLIPTELVGKKTNANYQLMVQPKAEIPKTQRGRDSLVSFMEKTPLGYTVDLHDGNVGRHNGRPVIFDW